MIDTSPSALSVSQVQTTNTCINLYPTPTTPLSFFYIPCPQAFTQMIIILFSLHTLLVGHCITTIPGDPPPPHKFFITSRLSSTHDDHHTNLSNRVNSMILYTLFFSYTNITAIPVGWCII